MMTNKLFRYRSLLRTAIVVILLIVTSSAYARTRTIKLGTLAPKGSSFYNILQQMSQQWEKVPGGGVKLRIYPGGVKGGEADMVRHMRTGGLDAGLLTVVGLSEIDDSVTALQYMPMMFRTLDEVEHVTKKLRSRLEERLRKKKFIVLFWVDAGWVHFFSKNEILSPDDLRKAKLFTWAGDPKAIEIYKSAGFRTIPLETIDILPSLQTGLINAVPMPPYAALAAQVDRNGAPHMLELNWAPLVGGLVLREGAWKKLTPETQAAIRKIAEEAGRRMQRENRAQSEVAVEQMKKRGLRVHKLTPELRSQWQAEAEKARERIRGEMVPADLFDEVVRILSEYRESRPAGGAR